MFYLNVMLKSVFFSFGNYQSRLYLVVPAVITVTAYFLWRIKRWWWW